MPLAPSALDRAQACLTGLAIGDALGMPAQTLPREAIRAHYGRITGFVAPFPGHPVSHGLGAAQVTDDTEQTILLARRLIADPAGFNDRAWAQDLLDWEADVKAKGLSDLLGPSSRRAIEALLAGEAPEQTGRRGTTNGAAMRIAPIGIMTPPDPDQLVARVARTCRVTHNTGEAIAAASAVAMIVSCGIAGQPLNQALTQALIACRAGQPCGEQVGETAMEARIRHALDLAAQGNEDALLAGTGTSVASHESVPAAIGILALTGEDVWQGLLIAANAGDDTDTIGAMVGAMAGALYGALPPTAVAQVVAANELDLDGLAAELLALRGQVTEGAAR